MHVFFCSRISFLPMGPHFEPQNLNLCNQPHTLIFILWVSQMSSIPWTSNLESLQWAPYIEFYTSKTKSHNYKWSPYLAFHTLKVESHTWAPYFEFPTLKVESHKWALYLEFQTLKVESHKWAQYLEFQTLKVESHKWALNFKPWKLNLTNKPCISYLESTIPCISYLESWISQMSPIPWKLNLTNEHHILKREFQTSKVEFHKWAHTLNFKPWISQMSPIPWTSHFQPDPWISALQSNVSILSYWYWLAPWGACQHTPLLLFLALLKQEEMISISWLIQWSLFPPDFDDAMSRGWLIFPSLIFWGWCFVFVTDSSLFLCLFSFCPHLPPLKKKKNLLCFEWHWKIVLLSVNGLNKWNKIYAFIFICILSRWDFFWVPPPPPPAILYILYFIFYSKLKRLQDEYELCTGWRFLWN